MPDYNDLFKKKIAAIRKKEAHLSKSVLSLEEKLYFELLDKFLDKLETSEGKIVSSGKNITILNAIDKIFDDFTRSKHLPVVRELASGILDVANLNDKYFEFFKDEGAGKTFAKVQRRVNEFVRASVGLDAYFSFKRDGFFDRFISDRTISNTLKQQTLKAIQGGIGLTEYKKQLKEFVVGNEKSVGAFSRYYKQHAFGLFMNTDTLSGKIYADALGMPAAVYGGNIIETSRDFCIERYNKVFTRAEIQKFGTPQDKYGGYTDKSKGKFNGKPKIYNPFIDVGGHENNCRHTWQWVTKAIAIMMRPDLKNVLN